MKGPIVGGALVGGALVGLIAGLIAVPWVIHHFDGVALAVIAAIALLVSCLCFRWASVLRKRRIGHKPTPGLPTHGW
jgi:hypothetical protein